VTQRLATFNKILFTKGDFPDKKCTKIVFVFDRELRSGPRAGRATMPPPDFLVRWGGKYLLPGPFLFPVNAFGVLVSGPVFF